MAQAPQDPADFTDRFIQFYRKYCRDEIGTLAQKYPNEQRSLYVDYDDLSTFDMELAEDYLAKPDQMQEYAEEALRLYDLPADVKLGRAHVRLTNLPETVDIRNIRVHDDHIGRLIAVQGIVRKATDVRPKITEAAFECQRCGTMTYIPQSDSGFQEPHECQGCERQGPFHVDFDQSEFVDAQKVRVQESPEGLRGGETPQNIDVDLEDDVTGRVTAGDHVTLTGVLHIEQQTSNNEKTPIFDLYMDGVGVEIDDEEFEDMNITEADVAEIVDLSNEPNIHEMMVDSVAPSIYGYREEKLAMILQLFSGVTKHLPDGSRIRGDLHMLLIGDPGTGKCVDGDTLVMLADGSEVPIRELVEENLDDPKPVDDGVWDTVDIDVPSMESDGSLTTRRATKVWKREAPERMYRIRTSSGKKIEVTPSHPLFVVTSGRPEAVVADDLGVGQSIAVPSPRNGVCNTAGIVAAERRATAPDGGVRTERIESVETVTPDDEWVYDLEIAGTHSYLTNGIVSHNSAMLQYIRNIAPRSVYTSGKGSSSAGLCVTGDTRIHTTDGFVPIQELATPEHPDPVSEETAAEYERDLYTFDRDVGSVEPAESSHVWRMPAKPCRRIETGRGKTLEASVNTPVLTCGEGGVEWKPVREVEAGDFVAAPKYDSVDRSEIRVDEFVEYTNEKLRLDDESIAFLRERLTETFGSLRDAAAGLDLSEDFIYDSLSNRFVPIDKLDRILDAIGATRDDVTVRRAMLKHGDTVRIPERFDADLLYLVGLVFGDGDIALDRRDGNRGLVRISNGNETLLERAAEIIESKFDKRVEIERQENRVPCIRLHSGTIARLFANLGMSSPKESLELDPRLTTAAYADAFLRGLMDADGSVSSRTDGGSSVQFSTISESLAEQVQLMLETYGVRSRQRTRDRRGTTTLSDGRTIESKHVQYHLAVYGRDIDRYAEVIGFESAEKRAALSAIVGRTERRDEKIPIGGALATAKIGGGGGSYYMNFTRGDNPGRERAREILDSFDLGESRPAIEAVVDADLRWEEVVAAVDTGEKEVYDLTVPGTHNFLGNGLVTHNTAAAVRDDFGDGQQWTLEAGALVLADKGIAAVDELDKMRCVTGDTLVHTADGIRRIRELAHEAETDGNIESMPSGRTIRNDVTNVWTVSDDGSLVQRPVTAVHEYDAPDPLYDVTLESGESVSTTPDHPFFVLDEGERVEKSAADLTPGDWAYVPESVQKATPDGGVTTTDHTDPGALTSAQNHAGTGTLSPAKGAILGYLAGDGNVYNNGSEGSYGIRFTNAEEQLLSHFESVCQSAYDSGAVRHPSEQREDGVGTVRLHGKAYVNDLLESGMNLETYEGKRVPVDVTRSSRETKAAFIRALADSEATVDNRSVKIHSSSYQLLMGTKMLLSEFGIRCQIQTRSRTDKRDLYVLAITAADSLGTYEQEIGFTLDRKRSALEAAVERTDGDRSILDVLPEVGDRLRRLRESLRLHQSECGLNGATYCDFENGNANPSLHRAQRTVDRFVERRQQAVTDIGLLDGPTSWNVLSVLREEYHVSQRELAAETEYSQQQISRLWGQHNPLRQTITDQLRQILTTISNTDLDEIRNLIDADVRWRRVTSVEPTTATNEDDRIPVLEGQLADKLGCDSDHARVQATKLLDTVPTADTWAELRSELERHDVSFQQLADELDVAGSTVSRWFSGTVETDNFESVRKEAFGRIEERRTRIASVLDRIEKRDRSAKVYDLTVEGTHNFVANGMVIHNSEDRSAMHEALEQQSYHPDSEILLSDGRRVEIGRFVDSIMADRESEVVDGVDCEILPVDDVGVHTVDFDENEVEKVSVDRVSRHEAPDEFVRVSLSNGRSVLVTPEHPMFVDDDGEVGTTDAAELSAGDFVPAPRKLPNSAAPMSLEDEQHRGKERDVDLPAELSPDLAEILGLLTAEGRSYSGGRTHEIGVSNQDERLLDRAGRLMDDIFGLDSTDVVNAAGTTTKRWVSTKLYRWFESNFPEVMRNSPEKRMPSAVLGASEEEIRRFLVGAFAGDGGVESEAMSFSTACHGLAMDYADALSKLGVASRIHHDRAEDSWKTYVMGDSAERFVEAVVDPADDRYEKARAFVERSNAAERHHDVLPTSAARELRSLKRLLGVPLDGRFRPNVDEDYGVQVSTVRSVIDDLRDRIEAIEDGLDSVSSIGEARALVGWSGRQLAERLPEATTSTVPYAETGGYTAAKRASMRIEATEAIGGALEEAVERLDTLESRCDLRYYRVTDVETVPNEGEYACEWVYDVTVEPTNTFVSSGVVLHNSISVSKAGINATLKSRCSLLGAANPKYGRFDQYEPIGEQIDLEPALISRFDLIFTVTDSPDPETDAKLAEHIINTNYAGELHTQRESVPNSEFTDAQIDTATADVTPEIDAELLRKYIAYARRTCYPTMTDDAKEVIQQFYVDFRAKGADEDAPVPVTARKLEALVRLSEASARLRLSDTVEHEDAVRVTEIVESCLRDIGMDPETGNFDADIVETGTSKNQRDRIKNLKELIAELEDEYDEGAPVSEVISRAISDLGLDESKAETEIEKLKRQGELYEPRSDYLRAT